MTTPHNTIQGNATLQQMLKTEREDPNHFESIPIETYLLERDDSIPMQFEGRCIGRTGADPTSFHGTEVTLYVTRQGSIITQVYQWQRTSVYSEEGNPAPMHRTRNAAAAHKTPQKAREWLIEDSGGHFGQASKAAWSQAVLVWPDLRESQLIEVIF